MPPKQTSEQIDVRLDELHAFVKSNAASPATADADSMLAVLSKRQRQCPEADKFRRWLHRTESTMTRLQQQRVIEIFELLTSASQQQEHATSASAKRSASALSDKSSKAVCANLVCDVSHGI